MTNRFCYLRNVNYYLDRFSVREELIKQKPTTDLGIVVVIPCSNEPNLIASLQSLYNCDKPTCSVEVIVVINASEKAESIVLLQNKTSLLEAEEWKSNSFNEIALLRQAQYKLNLAMTFYFIEENELPKKHAGVGLARKIGMDEAVRRFDMINNHQGIIACFDADALCETNYLVELEKHFKQYPKSPACSIHYEHPITGNEFPEAIYNGITQYELHLRYYKNGLAYANLPYAFHTIGSSMAVRSEAYQKQNGMNKRKAGEDFYFLQKLIPLGNFTELKTTKIIPSPRVSDRVPFGTGKAMQNWLGDAYNVCRYSLSSDNRINENSAKQGLSEKGTIRVAKQELLSYNPKSFIDLKAFTKAVPDFYNGKNNIPSSVQAFIDTIDFEENLTNIKKNSKSETHFTEVFFKWFNAFKVLKYMHFARDNYYPDVLVFEGANSLLKFLEQPRQKDNENLLLAYREIDLR